ncbi:hypothetical protein [Puia dinghuensis]|uniref:Lipoprotein n=1 Tax=Puia dinghuensis TaxID=1792502 RepID=A0A8J2XVT8_9BACT|nr:hypothetical protein [Puia dinghuensis]GGB18235.1 hypothetical protein GCM10011511_47580 [Puia dinghuensis]
MKTKFFFSLASVAVAAGLIIACSKSNSNNGTNGTTGNTSTTQVQTTADDESQVSTEMNAAENDVNNSLNASAAFNGVGTTDAKSGVVTDGGSTGLIIDYGICDATVTTDTANGLRQIVITYNGANCWGNRIRTGKIIISIPVGTHWRDKGAVVTVNIDTLKITRVRDHKTITLNGTYTFTNVTGGLLRDLASLGTITHTISANNVTIEFADSATRTWSVAKQRVFTYNNGVVITTTGTHSDGTNSDVAVWGTTRYGNSFETLIVQPMVIEQSCDWRLTSGQTETIRPDVTATITYGLDSNGNPTSCPGTGYYYYKAVWTTDGKTYTFIAPY